MKEFNSTDNTDMFLEEKELLLAQQAEQDLKRRAAIPGMLKPSEVDDGMADT